MKAEAWVFMLLVWSGVLALNVFCYRRILKKGRKPREEVR
jgi:hypothetical protein